MAALNQRMEVDGGKKILSGRKAKYFPRRKRIEVILEKTGIVFSDLQKVEILSFCYFQCRYICVEIRLIDSIICRLMNRYD